MIKVTRRKVVLAIFALVTSLLLTFPANTWVYQDGTPEDTKYEDFGPRADRLLIKLYQNVSEEWNALERGEIDITDSPLDNAHLQRYTTPPWNETINAVNYTSSGFYMLDINNANKSSSPVYPNPLSVQAFRQATAHVVNRTGFDTIFGVGQYTPIWVPTTPAMGGYYLDIPNPYPYDLNAAGALLDSNGFPVNSSTGWRYWDRNHNHVEDSGEYLELKFVIRIDHPVRTALGNMIADELNNINVRVNRIYAPARVAYMMVVVNRDFHLYISYLSSPPGNPTYLYMYHSSSNNYNGINDTQYDFWVDSLFYAATKAEAVNASRTAQQVFVNKSFKVPLAVHRGSKATYRIYTGGTGGVKTIPDDGENKYRRNYWEGTVNDPGYGIDNSFSFLNMHPRGFAEGDGQNMTIRYGRAIPEMYSLNPLYADLEWADQDWATLRLMYESLLMRNPYNSSELMPWIAKYYKVGTYIHPAYGSCTKIQVTLRTDVTWSDGTPLTTADVYFTFVELRRILESRGLPPPAWIINVQDILSFSILDPYNFEVLLDVLSIFTADMIGENIILPKHVWKPIVSTGDPTGFAPDSNMIGSGPWRLKEYVANDHVLMVKNKRGSIVQTNLPGSVPVLSPHGYFRLYPVHVNVHFKPPYEYSHRIPPLMPAEIKVTLENLIQESMKVQSISPVNFMNPVGSIWNETWPSPSLYALGIWFDDGNGVLSQGDIIGMTPEGPLDIVEWYHVQWVLFMPPGPVLMGLEPVIKVKKYVYLDDNLGAGPLEIYLKPQQPHEEQFGFMGFVAGKHTFKTAIHIEEPNWDTWRLNCTWINYTLTFWVTIREDICGSTLYDDIGFPAYPYKAELPSPDIKVDIKDIARACRAFGSYPGHPNWDSLADVVPDYKIDIKDIQRIAGKFGWHG